MQFKSGKFWSGIGRSFILGAFLIATIPSSFATLTVTQATGPATGSVGPGFYFPAILTNCTDPPGPNPGTCNPIPSVTGTLGPGFTPIDNAAQSFNALAPSSDTNIINFNVVSNLTTFPGFPTSASGVATQAIIVVTMSGTTGTTVEPIPILAYNAAACPSGGNCIGNPPDAITLPNWPQSSGNQFYRAAIINPGQTIQVGINIRAACDAYFLATGIQGLGCNTDLIEPGAGIPVVPTTNPGAQIALTFGLYVNTGVGLGWLGSASPAAIETAPATIYMTSVGPPTAATTPPGSLICSLSTAATVGDSSIVVNGVQALGGGTPFSMSTTAIPGVTDGLSYIYVLAKKTTVATFVAPTAPFGSVASIPGSTGTPAGTYDIDVPVVAAPGQSVGGFQDSSGANLIPYQLGFAGQDFYGFLVDNPNVSNSTTPTGCLYPFAFETAKVLGFLDASKCFIATATFRDINSAPVILLREFRDRFLERFSLGKGFVRWYYHWSPPAARWLVENPEFRFPVFLALIPLQTLAWLILHPAMLTFLFMITLSILGYGISFRFRKKGLPG